MTADTHWKTSVAPLKFSIDRRIDGTRAACRHTSALHRSIDELLST